MVLLENSYVYTVIYEVNVIVFDGHSLLTSVLSTFEYFYTTNFRQESRVLRPTVKFFEVSVQYSVHDFGLNQLFMFK